MHALLIVWLFCTPAPAIEFAPLDEKAVPAGVVFRIAVPKPQYKLCESIDVYAQFLNTTDEDVYLPLGPARLLAPGQFFSKLSVNGLRPITYFGRREPSLVIQAHEEATIYLGEVFMEVGQHPLQYAYECPTTPERGTWIEEVWGEELRSNIVTITVLDEALDESERAHLVKRCRHVVESVIDQDSASDAVDFLVKVPPYCVPVLREALGHDVAVVRWCAVKALGRIARHDDAAGPRRDTSAIDDLIAAYHRDSNPDVRAAIANDLDAFSDVLSEDQRKEAVALLKHALTTDVDTWKMFAAISLLKVDREEGVPAVTTELIEGGFGETSVEMVMKVLERQTGARYDGSIAELEEWWFEHAGTYGITPPGKGPTVALVLVFFLVIVLVALVLGLRGARRRRRSDDRSAT